jgi:hypothetical protein
MALQINGISIVDTDYLKVAVGITDERPVTAIEGMLRFNTTNEKVELASFSEINTDVILWKQLPFFNPIPDKLSFTLQQDTGLSSTDNITSNGATVVSGINVTNGYWEYSTNSGASWTPLPTNVNSFILNNGTYAVGQVQVRQTNAVGFTSIPATNPTQIIVDGTAPLITINTISVDNVLISNEDPGVTAITGVVTSDSAVTLKFNTVTRNAIVNGTSWTYTVVLDDLLALGAGSNKVITATGTDRAGNTATTSKTVTVGIAPSNVSFALAEDTGTSTTDKITKNGTVLVLDINVGAGGSWQYSIDGGNSWTSKDLSTNTFELAEGTYTANKIQVRQTNSSGYSSIPVGNTSTIKIDTTSPTITINTISSDNILVDNVDPGITQITGTVTDANVNTVKLTFGATIKTASISGSTWTYTVVAADLTSLGYGTNKTIIATATDLAGNTDGTATRTVTVVQAPSQLTSIALAQDTGSSATDKITSNGTMTVTGISASAAKWQYSTDSGASWTDGSTPTAGTSSFVLGEGTYAANQIQARQFSADGNYPSTPIKYASAVTVDTTAPSVTMDVISGDDIITGTTTITGTVESGRTVTLTLKTTTRTATVSGTTWSYALTSTDIGSTVLGTGVNIPITATTSADTAGNIGTVTRYVTNTTVPATLTLALASDTGISTSDRITNNGRMNVSGVVTGGIWRYSIDAGANWSADQASTTTFFTLDEGSYSANNIKVQQFNAQNYPSAITTYASAVVVDKTSPTVTMNIVSGDNILISSEDAGVTSITGTVNDDYIDTVKLTFGTTTKTASITGTSWSYTIVSADLTALGIGTSKVITATATDKAGNTATATQTVTYTSVPAALTLTLASDTGSSASDRITSNGTMTVSGQVTGGYWQYSTNGGSSWSANQAPTTTSFVLSEGTYDSVNVRQFNAQNYPSAVTTYPSTITVDTTAPTITMNIISGDDIIISSQDAGVTSITGTVTSGSTVSVSLNGTVRTATVSGTTWSYLITSADFTAMGAGTGRIITATATDTAGNASSTSRTITVTTVPPKLTLALASDTGSSASDYYTSNGTINVSGITVGSTGSWQYSINGGGSWTTMAYNVTSFTLGEGSYAVNVVQVRQTNAQGYSSDITFAPAITVDKTAPIVTINAVPALTYASLATPTYISGTIESGYTVSLSGPNGAIPISIIGTNWSCLVTEAVLIAIGEGASRTITATTSADQAGNIGTASRTVSVTTWGSIVFTTPGTRTWTLPDPYIPNIHVVCIGGGSGAIGANGIADAAYSGGGGGTGYKKIVPTYGTNYTVVVGAGSAAPYPLTAGSFSSAKAGDSYFGSLTTVAGKGAGGATSGTIASYTPPNSNNPPPYNTVGSVSQPSGSAGTGGGYVGDGGGNGANGVRISTGTTFGSGGNAGSYTGAAAGTTGTGSSLYGSTVAGSGPGSRTTTGNAQVYYIEPDGGAYGAGGSTRIATAQGGDGANGAVRIVWGVGRSFPSTNVNTATNETSG